MVFRNVLSMVGGNVVVRTSSSATPTAIDAFRDTTTRFSSSVEFACYARFVINEGTRVRARVNRLHDCLRSVNSYMIIMGSSRVVGIRIRARRPNGTLSGKLRFNRLLAIGIRGVGRRRGGIGSAGGGTRGRGFIPTRPRGSFNFITITTNGNLGSLFGSLNYSGIISNNRDVGPDASSVCRTVVTAPTGGILILPGGGGVVLTTRRAVPVMGSEGIVVIPAEAVPRNVATVLGFSPRVSTRDGTRLVASTLTSINANLMAFTTEDDRFNNGGVGRNSVVTLRGNELAVARGDAIGTLIGLTGSVIDHSASFVALVCNRSMDRRRTRGTCKRLHRGFNSEASVALMGNSRPICCFVLDMRWTFGSSFFERRGFCNCTPILCGKNTM